MLVKSFLLRIKAVITGRVGMPQTELFTNYFVLCAKPESQMLKDCSQTVFSFIFNDNIKICGLSRY
jgi:hypothetical protein